MKTFTESVSIIIPAYQEAGNIANVVADVKSVLQQLSCETEVIVVCDGSTDGTGDVAEKAGANVVRHAYNKGYGAALKTGIRAATFGAQTLLGCGLEKNLNAMRLNRLVVI